MYVCNIVFNIVCASIYFRSVSNIVILSVLKYATRHVYCFVIFIYVIVANKKLSIYLLNLLKILGKTYLCCFSLFYVFSYVLNYRN